MERALEMWCLWSAKGGVGCTVAATATALLLARSRQVLLVDLGGDVPGVLGRSDDGPGIAHWLATEHPPPDALSRLEIEICSGLSVLPWGVGAAGPPRLPDGPEMLAMMLGLDHRTIVVDVGLRHRAGSGREAAEQLLRLCSRSTLVIRPCRLALRAAEQLNRPDDVVVIGSGGRAVRPQDVEAAIGAPVVARLGWDAAVGRSVDAGLLRTKMPRSLRPLAAASAP
jgi:MinD-like ATPase involved in chromosome partitioning or flagellar assembly